MAETLSRRNFVKSSVALTAAGVATAASRARVRGANERIRLAFIGTANRGGQLIEGALPHEDAEIVAVCDVWRPAMEQWAEKLPGKVDMYSDYRKVLERDDVDAVVIGTPDHWHALQTVDACRAGKDVYVEKPLSLTVSEGRRMVEVARETERVVQVGTHRRSGAFFYDLADKVQAGEIGPVSVSHCYRISNMYPDGIGKVAAVEPPDDLDWDMWLGPQAWRPYQPNIHPYKFRWWKEYSSQVGNWGVHYFDLIRWILNEQAPVSVCAMGSNAVVDDDRTIPVTMQATFELPSGGLVIFGQYEASGNTPFPRRGEIELRGALGTLYASGNGWEMVPEHGGQFQDSKPRMEPQSFDATGSNSNLTRDHMRNFLDCIKSREKPNADVEIGHRSTTFSHLANISLWTRSRIDWDPDKERITNNEAANAYLSYEYRAPWKLG